MTIMEYDEVFFFVLPLAFALDRECAALGHEGNTILEMHGAGVDGCWISREGRGRAAAAMLTLLLTPVAPLSAFWCFFLLPMPKESRSYPQGFSASALPFCGHDSQVNNFIVAVRGRCR